MQTNNVTKAPKLTATTRRAKQIKKERRERGIKRNPVTRFNPSRMEYDLQ